MIVSKTEAFNALGYPYASTRGVWTAEREGRVLITIWQRIIRYMPTDSGPLLYVDLNELEADGVARIKELPAEAKHRHRAARLEKALSGEAELDVVVLHGPVDNPSGKATVWLPDANEGLYWRVVRVDGATGHYRLEARKTWN